jgi:hypothetical protein
MQRSIKRWRTSERRTIMDWKDLAGPLVAAGAPTLGKIVGAMIPVPGGALIGEAAGNLLAKAFGVEPKPEVVQDAINSADPQVALEKIKAAEAEATAKWPALAEMAKAQHEAEARQWEAQLADVQSARAQTIDLAKSGSAIAWGAPVVSGMVVAGFIAILMLWMVRPPGSTDQVIVMLVGSLSTAFGAVVSYWLGSSAGSKGKDQTLGSLVAQSQQIVARVTSSAPAGFKLFK